MPECDIQCDDCVCWPFRGGQETLERSRIYTAAKQMVESARQDTSHTFLQPKGEWWRQHVVLPPALGWCIIKACLKKEIEMRGKKKKYSHPSRWLTFPASLGETTHHKVPKAASMGFSLFINGCFLCSHWIWTHAFQFQTQIFPPATHTRCKSSRAWGKSEQAGVWRYSVLFFSVGFEKFFLFFFPCCLKNARRESDVHGTITGWDIDCELATAWRMPTSS